jgi:hypothetical protein
LLQSWLATQLTKLEQTEMPTESPKTVREEASQPSKRWMES